MKLDISANFNSGSQSASTNMNAVIEAVARSGVLVKRFTFESIRGAMARLPIP